MCDVSLLSVTISPSRQTCKESTKKKNLDYFDRPQNASMLRALERNQEVRD